MSDIESLLAACKRLDSQGFPLDAIKLLSTAIHKDHSDPVFLYHRGLRLERLGKNEEALADYSLGIRRMPDSAELLLARGRLLIDRMGNVAAGMRDFLSAVEHAPESAFAHQNICLGYLKIQMAANALEHAELAVSLDPSDAMSHFCLGECHLVQKQYAAASKQLETAVSIDPSSPNYWNAYGRALRGAGNLQKAEECFLRTIRLASTAHSWISLAGVQLQLDKPKECMESLESARKFELNLAERALIDAYLGIATQRL